MELVVCMCCWGKSDLSFCAHTACFTLSSHRKDKQRERDNSGCRDQRFVDFHSRLNSVNTNQNLFWLLFNLYSETLHCQPHCDPLHGGSYIFVHASIYSLDALWLYHEAPMESDGSKFELFQNQKGSGFK